LLNRLMEPTETYTPMLDNSVLAKNNKRALII